MDKKAKRIEYLKIAMADKDFKFKLNPYKLVFPVYLSSYDKYHEALIDILRAFHAGKITRNQKTGFKNLLKNKYLNKEEYYHPQKLPFVERLDEQFVNLGEVQQFFSKEGENNFFYPSLFDTTETLVNSFKQFGRGHDLNPKETVELFFRFIPYLKNYILDNCRLVVNTDGYCCEDCDGDYDYYCQFKRQHLIDMAAITLAKIIK